MPAGDGAQTDGQVPPWRRLFHKEQAEQEEQAALSATQQQDQEQQAQGQQQGVQEPEALSEVQEQMLMAYRKTFLVAGAGLIFSTWRWNTVTKHKLPDVFLPPRAQALPEPVVQRYKQKAQFREGVAEVGRQSLKVTGIAALYFGTELAVGLLRDRQGDWANTAAAGVVAGGVLGSRVPVATRGRPMAVGSLIGGLLGGLSGWTQQYLFAMYHHHQQQQQPGQPALLQPPDKQQQ